MKNTKAMLWTLFCAAIILSAGYVGIVFGGKYVMKTSSEPEQVTMTGDIASLFYSELAANVELTPWNYYVSKKNNEDNSSNRIVFSSDSPYLQEEVFYELIAEVTGSEAEEIANNYANRRYRILEKMTQGEKDGQPIELYFYRGYITQSGQKYRVKIACDKKSIISFSCIPIIEGGMTSVAGWREKRKDFLEELKKNPQGILEEFADVYNTFYSKAREKDELNIEKLQEKEDVIQVMELKNSILLVIEEDITVGLYYDILGERVSGFHFFYE